MFWVDFFQEKVSKAQEVKDAAMSNLAQAIENEKKEQWRAEGRSLLFDAKRVSSTDFVVPISFVIMSCCLFKQQDMIAASICQDSSALGTQL